MPSTLFDPPGVEVIRKAAMLLNGYGHGAVSRGLTEAADNWKDALTDMWLDGYEKGSKDA